MRERERKSTMEMDESTRRGDGRGRREGKDKGEEEKS